MTSQSRSLIHNWILEYLLYITWDEFEKTHFINDQVFVEAALAKSKTTSEQEAALKAILHLLCKLAQGDNPRATNFATSVTPLEEALTAIYSIINLKDKHLQPWKSLVKQTKEQAVLVCLRAEEDEEARKVFLRLWAETDSGNDQKSREALADLLDGRAARGMLKHASYEQYLRHALAVLSCLKPTEPPHLVQFASRLQNKQSVEMFDCHEIQQINAKLLAGVARKYSLTVRRNVDIHEPEEMSLRTDIIKDYEVLTSVANGNDSNSAQNTMTCVERVVCAAESRERVSPRHKGDSEHDVSASIRHDEHDVSASIRQHRLRRNRYRRDRHALDSESPPTPPTPEAHAPTPPHTLPPHSPRLNAARGAAKKRGQAAGDGDEEPDWGEAEESTSSLLRHPDIQAGTSHPKKKRLFNPGGERFVRSPPPKQQERSPEPKQAKGTAPAALGPIRQATAAGSGRRNPWSMDETVLLYKAVKRVGVGRWADIKLRYGFPDRSNVQLKDRWRNMNKDVVLMADLRQMAGP